MPFADILGDLPSAQAAPAPEAKGGFAGVAEDLGPKVKIDITPGRVSRGEAAKEGDLAGASANFRDEVYGASKASGLPDWMGGFRAPFGAAQLAYEHATGNKGEASKAY